MKHRQCKHRDCKVWSQCQNSHGGRYLDPYHCRYLIKPDDFGRLMAAVSNILVWAEEVQPLCGGAKGWEVIGELKASVKPFEAHAAEREKT